MLEIGNLPRWVLGMFLLVVVTADTGATVIGGSASATPTAPRPDTRPQVRYSALSQRWLSDSELKQFKDVIGVSLSVRIRLSNDGETPVWYLARAGSVCPMGYQLFRRLGETVWQSTSPSRGREGPPGSEFTGVVYSWLELPAGSAIEMNAHDYSRAGEEHAFSTFVKTKKDGPIVEVIMEPYRPLIKP